MINQNIFKSYDIRGVYPEELDKKTAFLIGRAFVRKTGAKDVVVGYDARLSSIELMKAFEEGVASEGSKVTTIGQAPSECLYFAAGYYSFDAGVMITASHNPKEYNGFKMTVKNGNNIQIISGKELLAEVQQLSQDKVLPASVEVGQKDIWSDYVKHVLSFVDLSKIMPLKIVVDASNGVAVLAIEKIKDKLPC